MSKRHIRKHSNTLRERAAVREETEKETWARDPLTAAAAAAAVSPALLLSDFVGEFVSNAKAVHTFQQSFKSLPVSSSPLSPPLLLLFLYPQVGEEEE